MPRSAGRRRERRRGRLQQRSSATTVDIGHRSRSPVRRLDRSRSELRHLRPRDRAQGTTGSSSNNLSVVASTESTTGFSSDNLSGVASTESQQPDLDFVVWGEDPDSAEDSERSELRHLRRPDRAQGTTGSSLDNPIVVASTESQQPDLDYFFVEEEEFFYSVVVGGEDPDSEEDAGYDPEAGSDGSSSNESLTLYSYLRDDFQRPVTELPSSPCTICLDNILEIEQARQLRCNHVFHGSCITRWLRNNRTCPLCRQDPHARTSTTKVT